MSDTLFPDLEADDPSAPQVADRRASRGFVVRTDGAARGNPGPASLGAALYDLERPDARNDRARPDASISDYLGVQTNNVAEYTGVVRALELARELGAREVHLLLDSKLIVEQLAGRWRVKDAKLIPLWTAARQSLGGFDALVRDARAARPELGCRRAGERGDRSGGGRRPGVGGPAPGRLTGPAAVDRGRLRSVSEAVGWSRVAGGATRRRREESPSSPAQGGG